jgi:hypothetical protein
MITFEGTCYGHPCGTYPTPGAAKTAMNTHIRTCPKGAMEWAKRIRWHQVFRAWTSAAQGEWLNHAIRERGHPEHHHTWTRTMYDIDGRTERGVDCAECQTRILERIGDRFDELWEQAEPARRGP